MNIEELRSFVDNYKKVEEKIQHIFEVLQTVDRQHWTTGRGIINFTIDEGCVCVSYDDSRMGCWDEGSNSFDAEWLLLSDEELVELAKEDLANRKEAERLKNMLDEASKKKADETAEYERFIELKKKFEPTTESEKENADEYVLTDDDGKPFNSLSDASHLAAIWWPSDVTVATVDGNKLCKTDRSRAWDPSGEYSYFFWEDNKNK